MQSYPVQLAGIGVNDDVLAQVDPTHDASRVNLRPLEHVSSGVIGGHYFCVASYSNTAAKPAAGSDVASLRWTDSRFFFVLKRLAVNLIATTGYTAAGAQDLALYVARDFSVAPSGGTQVVPLAGGQVARSGNMKKTGLDGTSGVLWVSSGDLLTTGTRTLDTQPAGYLSYANPTAVGGAAAGDLFNLRDFGLHPIVLTAGEGLVVQTPIGNAQAAGVSKYALTFEWAEVPAY